MRVVQLQATKNVLSLGHISHAQFLKEYWQKKPLVIQQGFKNFNSPISAEELAGLACEEDVNSRIVIEKDGERPWQLIEGPMDEAVFENLPETHWTLLVNDVEKHIPSLASIVDAFRFIPEWRVDDLMISYAPEGGSVGPHLDQYDVFILQAQGHRRWQISTQPVSKENQVDDADLKIQKDFSAEKECLLAPGDIIYIPPGVSHYGVATDDCLSFSIGFRAPTHSEMLGDFIDYISKGLPLNKTYKDKNLIPQQNSNEITDDALDTIRSIFSEYLNPNHPELAKWFGCFVSDTKTDLVFPTEQPVSNFQELKESDIALLRNPASRFAFYQQDSKALLFVDGASFNVSLCFAEGLCQQREYDFIHQRLSVSEQQLIVTLYNAGQIISANE